MNDSSGFANLVPGFDFLQGLVKNAGAALPGVGQWVAPTLDPDELEKRIAELRTVQFWLEQNARMLATTVQALEVQRMTLSTLRTMNVQMADLQESLTIKPAAARPAATPPAPRAPAPAPAASDESDAAAAPAASGAADKATATPAIDPMLWWGALTRQFSEIATNALKDGAGKGMAAAMGRPSIDGVSGDEPPRKSAGAKKSSSSKAAKSRKSVADNGKAAKG